MYILRICVVLLISSTLLLNCSNRFFRSFQLPKNTFSLAFQMHCRSLTLNSLKPTFSLRPTRLPLIKAFSYSVPRSSYFTQAWSRFFVKANDPIRFEKELRDAINKDNVQAVKQVIKRDQKLLQQNDSSSVRADRSVPYLIQAAEHGNTQIIDALLLICKSEINLMFENPLVRFDRTRRLPSADHDYVTPLSMAVQHHNYQAALTLLKNGANPNMFTGDLKYPTVLALSLIHI